jgi:hypothetical protein
MPVFGTLSTLSTLSTAVETAVSAATLALVAWALLCWRRDGRPPWENAEDAENDALGIAPAPPLWEAQTRTQAGSGGRDVQEDTDLPGSDGLGDSAGEPQTSRAGGARQATCGAPEGRWQERRREMTPHVTKIIRRERQAVRCEAEVGGDGGHAGLIVLAGPEGARTVLGRTDPAFETAEEAVAAMEKVVEDMRRPRPAPETQRQSDDGEEDENGQ